jgi:signal transduction histidine kinase
VKKSETSILVVDDNREIIMILEECLKEEGYNVEACRDGETAFQLLQGKRYDVLITDLNMSVMSGLELIERAKAENICPVPIIITGYGSMDTAVQALRIGVFDYLVKPFRIEELMQILPLAAAYARAKNVEPRAFSEENATAAANSVKRITSLEALARRLLSERTMWKKKAEMLEAKLTDQRPQSDSLSCGNQDDFLNRMGELVRPVIHDAKGQLQFLMTAYQRALDYAEANLSGDASAYIKDCLSLSLHSMERIKRRVTELSYLGGKVAEPFAEIDITALVQNIATFVGERSETVRISVESRPGTIDIFGDREYLQQMTTNLVINAVEACDKVPGQVSITVEKLTGSSPRIRIVVADNGCGISPPELAKIYELHYTTKTAGSGIGLYLVKKAIELHDGSITCESTVGAGTTFTVELPVLAGGK